MPNKIRKVWNTVTTLLVIAVVIFVILLWALVKKVPVYETFVEGAKDGVNVTLRIVPYLTAIVVAVAMFRASGALDMLSNSLSSVLTKINVPSDILPLAIVRSLSGSAALGVFSDIASQNPPDSYPRRLRKHRQERRGLHRNGIRRCSPARQELCGTRTAADFHCASGFPR